MRRRLVVMSLAVTSMVVLAFVIPLGLLVADLAHDRVLSAAERDAEGTARFLAVVGPSRGISAALDALGGEALSEYAASVILPDGSVIGDTLEEGESVDQALAGTAARVPLPDGEAVHVPVVQADGSIVVVRVFVTEEELSEGVAASWRTLGILGLVLVGIAVVVSDAMARSVVAPVSDLSATAEELGRGNVDARVVASGPKEIYDVGVQFNRLAERVAVLIQQERETAADLSHRLRTPLMAVRLDAEALQDSDLKQRLLEDIDDLARRVDFVIREARKDATREEGGGCDISEVVTERVAFWTALAEEQSRTVDAFIGETLSALVWIDEEDARALVDALIGNVFAHTEEGVGFAVHFETGEGTSTLTVEDAGVGFSGPSVLNRGESRGTGTGLGLDIARSTAEAAGGRLSIGRSPRLGGAAVRVVVPLVSSSGEFRSQSAPPDARVPDAMV